MFVIVRCEKCETINSRFVVPFRDERVPFVSDSSKISSGVCNVLSSETMRVACLSVSLSINNVGYTRSTVMDV